ncbi:MAG: VCBS repeat-containing protein, partial [Verrucomicrobiae bacterium]|nr:VCBS repeat-containing protein [Verrucomicrobiae bacterium]
PALGARGHPIRGVITVGDAESAPGSLRVSAVSSRPDFLPDAAIILTGTGSERELVATPRTNAPGSAEITLTVTDPEGLSDSTTVALVWQEQLLVGAPLAEDIPPMTQALVADVDGDGLLDLVGVDAAAPDGVAVWRQTPAGGWTAGSRWATGLQIASRVSGDFDLDGDPDFVASTAPGSLGPGGATAVFLWNDEGRLERSTPLLLGVTAAKWVVLDADADGDPDLVAGVLGTDLRLWRHPGGVPGSDARRHWEPLPLENPQALVQGLRTDSYVEALLATDLDADGRMDLLLSRTGEPRVLRSVVLRQNPTGSFAAERPPWPPHAIPLAVADFDNDGVADPLVWHPALPPSSIAPITKVFAGRSRWVDVGELASPRTLGDLDGDGAEDLLLFASRTHGYGLLSDLMAERPAFTPQNFLGLQPDSLIPADLDGDGQLELFALQEGRPVWLRNLGAPPNQPPDAPSGLWVRRVASDEVELVWTAPRDAEQAGGLSYNVRVGTQPGSGDVVSALASPAGRALVPGRGNAGWRDRFRLRGLAAGRRYHGSVQAVDSGHARSGFAPEVSFTLEALPRISPVAGHQLPVSAGEQPAYWLRPEVGLAPSGRAARWQLVFRGHAGTRVELEQSRDLRTWESLGEHLIPSDEALSVEPPDFSDGASRFFRVVRRD